MNEQTWPKATHTINKQELTTVPRERREDDLDGPSYSVSMPGLARLMLAESKYFIDRSCLSTSQIKCASPSDVPINEDGTLLRT